MLKKNYIYKIKDLPESLRQFAGLIIITIIVIIGIFAYLIVFIPGYIFIVPDETEKLSDNKTSVQLQADSTAEKSSDQPIVNPGDAPPPK